MKVLLVTNDLTCTDGWSTYTHHLMVGMLQRGKTPVVLVHGGVDGESSQLTARLPYPPGKLMWNPLAIWRTARVLQSVIKQERPDVVHIVAEPYHMALCFLRVTVPVVLTIHGSYAVLPVSVRGLKKNIGQWVFRRAHQRVDRVIAVSETTKQRYLAQTPVTRPVSVVNNAFEKKCACAPRDRSQDRSIRVVTVGMVKPRKGILESINLLSEWARAHQRSIVYDVVGRIEEGSRYTQQVRQAATDSEHDYFQVVFHGQVTEAEKCTILNAATFYCHLEPPAARDVEGYGIGIIEAAAHGLPALVSNVGATQEAVQPGKTGFVVDLTNAEEIDTAITNLTRGTMVDATALTAWVANHNIQTVTDKILAVYETN